MVSKIGSKVGSKVDKHKLIVKLGIVEKVLLVCIAGAAILGLVAFYFNI